MSLAKAENWVGNVWRNNHKKTEQTGKNLPLPCHTIHNCENVNSFLSSSSLGARFFCWVDIHILCWLKRESFMNDWRKKGYIKTITSNDNNDDVPQQLVIWPNEIKILCVNSSSVSWICWVRTKRQANLSVLWTLLSYTLNSTWCWCWEYVSINKCRKSRNNPILVRYST